MTHLLVVGVVPSYTGVVWSVGLGSQLATAATLPSSPLQLTIREKALMSPPLPTRPLSLFCPQNGLDFLISINWSLFWTFFLGQAVLTQDTSGATPTVVHCQLDSNSHFNLNCNCFNFSESVSQAVPLASCPPGLLTPVHC